MVYTSRTVAIRGGYSTADGFTDASGTDADPTTLDA